MKKTKMMVLGSIVAVAAALVIACGDGAAGAAPPVTATPDQLATAVLGAFDRLEAVYNNPNYTMLPVPPPVYAAGIIGFDVPAVQREVAATFTRNLIRQIKYAVDLTYVYREGNFDWCEYAFDYYDYSNCDCTPPNFRVLDSTQWNILLGIADETGDRFGVFADGWSYCDPVDTILDTRNINRQDLGNRRVALNAALNAFNTNLVPVAAPTPCPECGEYPCLVQPGCPGHVVTPPPPYCTGCYCDAACYGCNNPCGCNYPGDCD